MPLALRDGTLTHHRCSAMMTDHNFLAQRRSQNLELSMNFQFQFQFVYSQPI